MSDKEKSYEEKEKGKIYHQSSRLEEKYRQFGKTNKRILKFGLCAKCDSFQFAETALSVFGAVCRSFKRKLSEDKPITDCTYFADKFIPSLDEMVNMATLVDDDKKDRIGFK